MRRQIIVNVFAKLLLVIIIGLIIVLIISSTVNIYKLFAPLDYRKEYRMPTEACVNYIDAFYDKNHALPENACKIRLKRAFGKEFESHLIKDEGDYILINVYHRGAVVVYSSRFKEYTYAPLR